VTTVPEPTRPLGAAGRAHWAEWWGRVDETDLLAFCELHDERAALRPRVLRDSIPQDRAALADMDRRLEAQLIRLRRDAAWRQYARKRGPRRARQTEETAHARTQGTST
jgi:hypothetical protein